MILKLRYKASRSIDTKALKELNEVQNIPDNESVMKLQESFLATFAVSMAVNLTILLIDKLLEALRERDAKDVTINNITINIYEKPEEVLRKIELKTN